MTANDQRRWKWPKVAQAKKTMEQQVWAYAKQARIPTLSAPIRISVTWIPKDRIRRDHDALGGCPTLALQSRRGRERANAHRPLTHSLEQAMRG